MIAPAWSLVSLTRFPWPRSEKVFTLIDFWADVCMAPARLMTEQDKTRRREAFEDVRGSVSPRPVRSLFDSTWTHDLITHHCVQTHAPVQGFYTASWDRLFTQMPKFAQDKDVKVPKDPRQVTDTVLKLAGLQEY